MQHPATATTPAAQIHLILYAGVVNVRFVHSHGLRAGVRVALHLASVIASVEAGQRVLLFRHTEARAAVLLADLSPNGPAGLPAW